ncbi:MAG: hypothetical protein MRY32_00170 [Rickettsiales bacterium]|nr:hypothetical protein [Rickettsiales bacterium]
MRQTMGSKYKLLTMRWYAYVGPVLLALFVAPYFFHLFYDVCTNCESLALGQCAINNNVKFPGIHCNKGGVIDGFAQLFYSWAFQGQALSQILLGFIPHALLGFRIPPEMLFWTLMATLNVVTVYHGAKALNILNQYQKRIKICSNMRWYQRIGMMVITYVLLVLVPYFTILRTADRFPDECRYTLQKQLEANEEPIIKEGACGICEPGFFKDYVCNKPGRLEKFKRGLFDVSKSLFWLSAFGVTLLVAGPLKFLGLTALVKPLLLLGGALLTFCALSTLLYWLKRIIGKS